MELSILRTYHPLGTNGLWLHEQDLVCYSIELPWLENMHNVSCIPEGRYVMQKRFTEKRGEHLVVTDVPERSGILVHPANYALEQLRGCIAPRNHAHRSGAWDSILRRYGQAAGRCVCGDEA
jgi:hypothetical protein